MSQDNCSCTERHKDPQCEEHGTFSAPTDADRESVRELMSTSPRHYAMGALIPPGLEWMKGKTVLEIGTISTLLMCRELMKGSVIDAQQKMVQHISELLVRLGVEK